MSEFNSKSRRMKAAKRGVDIARLEENFRAFVAMCVGAKKRSSHR